MPPTARAGATDSPARTSRPRPPAVDQRQAALPQPQDVINTADDQEPPEDLFATSFFDVTEALETADLLPREKELVLHVARRSFKPTAADPKKDEKWRGWVLIDGPTLSRHFDEQQSNLSDALIHLVQLGILARGKAPCHRYVRPLDPVCRWAQEVTDPELIRAARKARQARPGAGAPKQVRPRTPEVPLEERTTDAFREPFLSEDDLHNWIAAGEGICDPDLLAAMWPVVGWFQQQQDERFKDKWLPRLQSLVTEEGWDPLDIIRMLNSLKKRQRPPKYLWSYFLTTLDNSDTTAPRRARVAAPSAAPTAATREPQQEDPTHAKEPRAISPRVRRAPHTPAATNAAGTRSHGDFDAFVERPGRQPTITRGAVVVESVG